MDIFCPWPNAWATICSSNSSPLAVAQRNTTVGGRHVVSSFFANTTTTTVCWFAKSGESWHGCHTLRSFSPWGLSAPGKKRCTNNSPSSHATPAQMISLFGSALLFPLVSHPTLHNFRISSLPFQFSPDCQTRCYPSTTSNGVGLDSRIPF